MEIDLDIGEKPFSLEQLPENESSFSEIIRSKLLYVDKTRMIHKIIMGPKAPVFLARPRRFGKTLLLDTIQDVFEGKKELFDGLEIAKLNYDWKVFPVIRIDMSGLDTDPDKFEEDLTKEINSIAKINHGIDLNENSHVSALRLLIRQLSEKYKYFGQPHPIILDDTIRNNDAIERNVVILIDEYDAPILDNINDDKNCEIIRTILHKFYRVIKSQYSLLRAVFITGITKFKNLSLFSAFNNISDISLETDFSTICGFTENELRVSFKNHLASAFNCFSNNNYFKPGSTVEALIAEILSWYDGYSFDGMHTVLNPYSIVAFFAKQEFGDYWYRTGGSLFNHNYGLNYRNDLRIFDSDMSFSSDFQIEDPNTMNNTTVLMQSGYLTINSIDKSANSKVYHLKIPNNEVRNAIVYEILNKAIVPKGTVDTVTYLSDHFKDFITAFLARDAKTCESVFSAFISGFPSNLLGSPDAGEYIYHALLYCQLKASKLDVRCEQRVNKGISDIVVRTPSGDWIVIELKYEKSGDSLESDAILANSVILEPSTEHASPSQRAQNHRDPVPVHDGVQTLSVDPQSPLEVGVKSKRALHSLKRNISQAFKQIVSKNYATPYISDRNKIYALAVAVYGKSDVMFAFRDVVWSNEQHKVVSYG